MEGTNRNCFFIVSDHLTPELPKPFDYVGDFRTNKIYMATDYEPLGDDGVGVRHISANLGILDHLRPMENPRAPAQSCLVLRGGSSYLPDKTWVNSEITTVAPRSDSLWAGIFNDFFVSFRRPPESLTPSYVIEDLPATYRNIGFGPLSLFDGLPESAWCEGAKGDGIDEWIEFELVEDVFGVAIRNGFVKSPAFLVEHEEQTVVEAIQAAYGNNSRAMLVEFVSENADLRQRIHLEDTAKEQVFEDVYLAVVSTDCISEMSMKEQDGMTHASESWNSTRPAPSGLSTKMSFSRVSWSGAEAGATDT